MTNKLYEDLRKEVLSSVKNTQVTREELEDILTEVIPPLLEKSMQYATDYTKKVAQALEKRITEAFYGLNDDLNELEARIKKLEGQHDQK